MNEKKLRIGIDLDDVVFDFVNFLIKNYQEKFGKNILFEEISSFYFEKVFNLSREEINLFFKEIFTKDSVLNMDLCEFAKEVIFGLSKDNEIFFITSRVDAREGTLESLNKHFSEINFELFFSSNPYCGNKGKTKGQICKDLGIDFMIEDSKEHSEVCAEYGIKVFLLEKPWNKQTKEHKNIIKVKSWEEIKERLR